MSSGDPDHILANYRSRFGIYSWAGQSLQYDQLGAPDDVVYQQLTDGNPNSMLTGTHIDTLLYYDKRGKLAAILNHYPNGAVEKGTAYPLEKVGAINTFARPDDLEAMYGLRRLIDDAMKRWPNASVEPENQFRVRKNQTLPSSDWSKWTPEEWDLASQRNTISSALSGQRMLEHDSSGHRGDGLDGNRRMSRTRPRNR